MNLAEAMIGQKGLTELVLNENLMQEGHLKEEMKEEAGKIDQPEVFRQIENLTAAHQTENLRAVAGKIDPEDHSPVERKENHIQGDRQKGEAKEETGKTDQ